MERESMSFDVIIVGGGPAGLSAACQLALLAREQQHELSICLLEKGAEVGSHILSGAVLESRALTELFPDWKERGAPLETAVQSEDVLYLRSEKSSLRVPDLLVPAALHNKGNHIISLGDLCRWLAAQAEDLGVEILAGYAAADILKDDSGRVTGVLTGDMGIGKDGVPTANFTPGYALHATYTLFAEGSRGHLGKQLIRDYQLDQGCSPQHYALGIKEIWEVPAAVHRPGHLIHSIGWPLSTSSTSGGGFLYHFDKQQVS
ncbi:MAG TPA: NAD(P)/FAD-dependent oxidoreductase, partial [Pseudomonadaceae bacterium]|nr:NAD(P)/FAD-dependent oxidoreductase [Pseudomonadaceae bacterium]